MAHSIQGLQSGRAATFRRTTSTSILKRNGGGEIKNIFFLPIFPWSGGAIVMIYGQIYDQGWVPLSKKCP